MASWYAKQAFRVGPPTPTPTPASAQKKEPQSNRFSSGKKAPPRKPFIHPQDQPGTPRPKQGARRTLGSELSITTLNDKNREVFEPNLSQLTENSDPSKSSVFSNHSYRNDEQRSLSMQESSRETGSGGSHDDNHSYEGCCLGQQTQYSTSSRSASTARRFSSQKSSSSNHSHGYPERPTVNRSSSFDPSNSRGSASKQSLGRSPSFHSTRNMPAPQHHGVSASSGTFRSDIGCQQSPGIPNQGRSMAREPMTPMYYTQPPMTPRSHAIQRHQQSRTPAADGRTTPLASNSTNRYMTPNRTRKMVQEAFQEMFREFEAQGAQVGENLDAKGNAIADRLGSMEQEILQGLSSKIEEGQTAITELSDKVHAKVEAKNEERRDELANEKSEILRLETNAKENYEKAEELQKRLLAEMKTEKDTLAEALVPVVVDKAVPVVVEQSVPVVIEKAAPSIFERAKEFIENRFGFIGRKRTKASSPCSEKSSYESPAKKQKTTSVISESSGAVVPKTFSQQSSSGTSESSRGSEPKSFSQPSSSGTSESSGRIEPKTFSQQSSSGTSESSGGSEPKSRSQQSSSGSIQTSHDTSGDSETDDASKSKQDLFVVTPVDRKTQVVQYDSNEKESKDDGDNRDLIANASSTRKVATTGTNPSASVAPKKKGSSDKTPPRGSYSKKPQASEQVARKKKESNDNTPSRLTTSKKSDASGQGRFNNQALKANTSIRPTVPEPSTSQVENTNNKRRSSRTRKEVNYNVDEQFKEICPSSAFREIIPHAPPASTKTAKKQATPSSGDRVSPKSASTKSKQRTSTTPKNKEIKVKVRATDGSGGQLLADARSLSAIVKINNTAADSTTAKSQQRASTPKQKKNKVKMRATQDQQVADTRSPNSVLELFKIEAPPTSFVTHTQDSLSTISGCPPERKKIEPTTEVRQPKKMPSGDITSRDRKRKRELRAWPNSSLEQTSTLGSNSISQVGTKKVFNIKKRRCPKKYGKSRRIMDYVDDSAFQFAG